MTRPCAALAVGPGAMGVAPSELMPGGLLTGGLPPHDGSSDDPQRRAGARIHDGEIARLSGCPRNRTDCEPRSRVSSPDFESYMCCGQTSAAPVPTDTMRLCIKSTHASGVDMLVNFDERDATDTAFVLLGGLSIVQQDREHQRFISPPTSTEPNDG